MRLNPPTFVLEQFDPMIPREFLSLFVGLPLDEFRNHDISSSEIRRMAERPRL